MTLDKADFIQYHFIKYKDHCNGIFQWGRETELSSDRIEHGGGQWMKNY